MAFALLVLQTLVLVPALALLGQGVVGIFNWPRRRQNLVYRLFELIASPVVKVVRWITPKVVLDQHIPLGAFMLLVFAYFLLGFEHRAVCRDNVAQTGCERWAEAWSERAPKQ